MFLGIFRGTTFLGNFRGPRSSEIPDANSEEDFVGTSEDWTIGNFLGIYRRSPPSVYSEELSDDLVVLGVSSEIQFLGIPSEIFEGFPRKNEFPRSYFRGLFSSPYTNEFYARVAGVSNRDLNKMELELLFLLDFRVTAFESYSFHDRERDAIKR
ncbi:hypothetical protein DY000_02042017 [Brassica cretica]|uniref:Uncharacterized protein n=1 Tax=Brassica cretica TaxID=69181 RepID=A0ABQ7BJ29_BRACR|nr:hypothetical protein DY000_02042017 [Brassica cretica]